MQLEAIRVRAEVAMLTAEQDGRSQPLVGGIQYRPNHNFWPDDQEREEFAIGLVAVPVGPDLTSGDAFEASIEFHVWPELRPEIRSGRTWRIQEAQKVVGYGKILQVLP
ncbi:hypothetical protein [Rhizobium sp. LjRoot254]|uniref:hypothetical protein n=1 Tax=Rhizobium sp. LjRoot254 TaxID=3342297 RepID=UPI003ED0F1F1